MGTKPNDTLDNKNNGNVYETENVDYYPPSKPGRGKPRKYVKCEDVGERIIRSLAAGKTSEWISEHIGVYEGRAVRKQHIQYYKDMAMDKGIIVETGRDDEGRGFKCYGRGPNYHLLKYKNWQYRSFEPILCRLHPSNGNPISVSVAISNINQPITILDSNNEGHEVKFLSHLERRNGYYVSSDQLLIPFEVIGHRGAYATVVFKRFDSGSEFLSISPPEVHWTFGQLTGETPWWDYCSDYDTIRCNGHIIGHEDDPFCFSVGHILYLLEDNGWEFDWWDNDQPLHFAFDEKAVKTYYPPLLKNVTPLRSGDREEELILYTDRSHGHRELETTDKHLAIEIMNLMEFNRLRLSGERHYP